MLNLKIEFSKKLLIVDYLILMVLFICSMIFRDVDFTSITIAWIAQLGISSGAYYWKAKCENRTKVPLKVIESLPKDMRDQLDLTQVITSIIQND
jgi:hypothetical protein